MEERTSDTEGRNLEMIQMEEERDIYESKTKWKDSVRTIWLHQKEQDKNNSIPEGEEKEKGPDNLFKQIVHEFQTDEKIWILKFKKQTE